jgi:hypothetical protein
MRRIVRFARLPAADRRLLATAAALLCATRVGLWLFPFGLVQRVAARLEQRHSGPADPGAARRVVWAVDVASRYVASGNCLNRALTAKVLLARHGLSTHLRIGVRRDSVGGLLAHAWVESADGVLIGNLPELSRYAPLHSRESAAR